MTVSVSFSDDGVTVNNSFPILVTYLEHLNVTAPNKTSYQLGDTLDYSGLKVEAVYKNSDTSDVTSSAVITPTNGTVITKDIVTERSSAGNIYYDLSIHISYTDSYGDSKTASVALELPPHIKIIKPNKIDYQVGEALDYSGLMISLDGDDISIACLIKDKGRHSGSVTIVVSCIFADY